MADITLQHSSMADGTVIVEFDISTANWRVSQVRCINNSPYPAAATIRELGAVVFGATAPPSQTSSWNTSGIQLGWQPDVWDEENQEWIENGLEMGDYVFEARWPA